MTSDRPRPVVEPGAADKAHRALLLATEAVHDLDLEVHAINRRLEEARSRRAKAVKARDEAYEMYRSVMGLRP